MRIIDSLSVLIILLYLYNAFYNVVRRYLCFIVFFLKKKEEIDVFREEKNKRVLKRID